MERTTRSRTVFLLLVVAAILSGLALTACGGGDDDAATGEQIVIGWPFPVFVPALEEVREAAFAEADKIGNVSFEFASPFDPAAQASAIENLLAKQVDALIIQPWDATAIVPSIAKANEAGVPVIIWLSESEGGEIASTVNTGEMDGGFQIAEWLGTRLNGEGQVALLQGDANHPAGRAREDGVREALANFPGIELAGYDSAGWVADVGERVSTNLLTATPELNAIIALNDEMAFGALKAVEGRDRQGQTLVTGYNGQCSGLAAVWNGEMEATLYQPWRDFGRTTVALAVQAVRGETVPERVDLDAEVIDKPRMEAIHDGTATDVGDGVRRSVEVAINGCA